DKFKDDQHAAYYYNLYHTSIYNDAAAKHHEQHDKNHYPEGNCCIFDIMTALLCFQGCFGILFRFPELLAGNNGLQLVGLLFSQYTVLVKVFCLDVIISAIIPLLLFIYIEKLLGCLRHKSSIPIYAARYKA